MNSPIWHGSQVMTESSNSPRWSFGQKVTCIRSFSGPYDLALSSAPMCGALGLGTAAGMRVAESTVDHDKGGIGRLVIKYETNGQPTQGSQLPVDEIRCELQQIERDLRKHPRYATAVAANPQALTSIKTLLETSKDSEDWIAAFDRLAAMLYTELLNELWDKLESGFTSYVLYVPVIRTTKHYWDPPTGLSLGGSVQAPPDDVLDPPTGVYLRAADSVTFNGSTWELSQQWIGAPDWDADIYGA